MSGRILCSTGALIGKPNNRNFYLLEELRDKLECDGYEFMMYSTWYGREREIENFLKSLGIWIPVMHCEKHIGEAISTGDFETAGRLFYINCEMACRLGAKKMVIHLWDGLTSDANIKNNIEFFSDISKTAKEFGILPMVENVVCNHENPMKHWCELVQKYEDISFVFDTKMAQFHDQLSLLYEDKYKWLMDEGHIKHFHINDYKGGYMDWASLKTLPVGAGNVDFDSFFSWLNTKRYGGFFTIEATAFMPDGYIDTDMLNNCFKKLRLYTKMNETESIS